MTEPSGRLFVLQVAVIKAELVYDLIGLDSLQFIKSMVCEYIVLAPCSWPSAVLPSPLLSDSKCLGKLDLFRICTVTSLGEPYHALFSFDQTPDGLHPALLPHCQTVLYSVHDRRGLKSLLFRGRLDAFHDSEITRFSTTALKRSLAS